MRIKRIGADGGFTILEVIVASFLLAVGLVATAQLTVMATGQVALQRQQSDATSLAQQTIEALRDVNFSNLTSGSSTTTTVSGTTYTVNPIVQPGIPQANTTMVTVTVSWRGGQQRYVTSTILSPLQ